MHPKGWIYDKRCPHRPYRANLFSEGKCYFLGSFKTAEEAHAAYQAKREEMPRRRSGGNPGYRYPKKKCSLCRKHFSESHFGRHEKACQKKYPQYGSIDL